MTKASDNDYPSILVTEQGSAPSSPAASHQRLYIRTSDHTLVTVNSSGTVTPVGTVLVGGQYERTAGNYTTTSTTFVAVDSTNLKFTLTTGAHHVLIGLAGAVSHSTAPAYIPLDVAVDGTLLGGGDYGLEPVYSYLGSTLLVCSFTIMTGALSAGSHTFELQWRTTTGTATLHGSTGADSQLVYWAAEQPF